MKFGPKKKTLYTLVFCQFISALSALGMPPFFPQMMQKSFSSQVQASSIFAGIFYVLPTLFSAIASPIWGHLADQYGKKRLLLRAQLGLTLSFLCAGFAQTPLQFAFSLLLQGLLGGTYAASRAFLTDSFEGAELAHGLTLIEVAPKAALVIAPALAGSLLSLQVPIEIYRYLCVLPLIAALLTAKIPESKPRKDSNELPSVLNPIDSPKSSNLQPNMALALIYGIQFSSVTATVVFSPYFTAFTQNRFPFLSNGQLGLLFSLPHLIYLASAGPLSRLLDRSRAVETLMAALVLQSFTLLGQGYVENFSFFAFWRASMGISMTACFISMHQLISQYANPNRSGILFGWLETCNRSGTFLAGVIASIGNHYFGAAPLAILSTLILVSTALVLTSQKFNFLSKETLA